MKSFAVAALSAGMANGIIYRSSGGQTLTDLVSETTASIEAFNEDKLIKINILQNVTLLNSAAAGDAGEAFMCFRRADKYECAVLNWVATNPSVSQFTITISSYTKTTAPNADDFTVDKSFINGTKGFATGSNYTKKYVQSGTTSSAGSAAATSGATTASSGYSYETGNKVSGKTIYSEFKAENNEEDAAAAVSLLDIIKAGAGTTL